jgi:L-threonylcarbamoyladenylate synthase
MDAISGHDLAEAVEALQDGGTVIYPTETCYGIGCDALDTTAVKEIYRLKQRPREKKLTTIVADLDTAEEYCHLSDRERRVCEAFMPGPVTLIAEKKPIVPDVLNTSFAFRVSSGRVARELASGLGRPIVATSANISGQPSSFAVDEIAGSLQDGVDHVLDAGRLAEGPSSTVIDLQDGDLTVHREGPITQDDILEALNSG